MQQKYIVECFEFADKNAYFALCCKATPNDKK